MRETISFNRILVLAERECDWEMYARVRAGAYRLLAADDGRDLSSAVGFCV